MHNRIAVAVLAILLGAGLAASKTKFTPISGSATQIAPPAVGELKCIGGTPTGTWPPCTPGSKTQIRGWDLTYRQEFRNPDGTLDPLFTGTRTLVFNGHLDENGHGHLWGTWHVVLDDGVGEWEGTYTAFARGWFGAAEGQVVGHGTQGQVDGMELRAVFSYETWPRDPGTGLPGLETLTGYRFDPGGRK